MSPIYNYLAEFVGTLLVIYVYLETSNPLAVGAAIALVMLLIMNVSGAYLNPALTIVAVSNGNLSRMDLLPYCIAQVMGGLFALEIHKRYPH